MLIGPGASAAARSVAAGDRSLVGMRWSVRVMWLVGSLAIGVSFAACGRSSQASDSARVVPATIHFQPLDPPVALSAHAWRIASGKSATGQSVTVIAMVERPLFAHTKGSPGRSVSLSVELSGFHGGDCWTAGSEAVGNCTDCGSREVAVSGQAPNGTASAYAAVSGGHNYEADVFSLPASIMPRTKVYVGFIPVAHPKITGITALDADGGAIRVPANAQPQGGGSCQSDVSSFHSEPVQFLPGGIRKLVQGTLPTHEAFSIVARRYRFQGHIYFDLSAQLQEPARALGGRGGGGGSDFSPSQSSNAFPFSQLVVCSEHPMILLWGLLRAPSDTAFLGEGSKDAQLTRVSIPMNFHTRGELAYGFLKSSTTLIVKNATGKVIEKQYLEPPPPHSQCAGGIESIHIGSSGG